MKKVIRKTVEERQEEKKRKVAAGKKVKVSDTLHECWVCSTCDTAFFDNDEILRSDDGSYFCSALKKGRFPFLKKLIFGASKDQECGEKLRYGTVDYLEEYYKILDL